MKKIVLDLLKTKFPGVSDAILGRIADGLANTVTTEEQATTAVEGVTQEFINIMSAYGDSRATEASETTRRKLESKYGLKDGKPAVSTGDGGEANGSKDGDHSGGGKSAEGADAIPAWAKPMMEFIDGLKHEKTVNTRKSRLTELIKSAPETIRQRYEKDFARMNFKDDEDFEGWLTEITPDINSISNDFQAKGGVVSRPKSGGAPAGSPATNPYLQERIQERNAAKAAPAIQGLPTQTTN